MDEDPHLGLISIAFIALLLGYCFLLLASYAVSRSRYTRILEMIEAQRFGAATAEKILKHRDAYMISIHFAMFLDAALMGSLVPQMLNTPYVSTLWHRVPLIEPSGQLGSTLLLLLLCGGVAIAALFTGQLVKNIALYDANRVLCIMAPSLTPFSKVLGPVGALTNTAALRIVQAFGVSPPALQETAISAEELSELVTLSRDAGEIEDDEREMIEGVFGLSDTAVREVMTPRQEVVSVAEDASLGEIIDVFKSKSVSRLIVRGEALDDVKGLLFSKDFVSLIGADCSTFSVRQHLRKPYFVRHDKKTDELFRELRARGLHLAVVLDEHGGVDGVVTMEDLLEEIVGEIFDEFDKPEDEIDVQQIAQDTYLVNGGTQIESLNDDFDLALPCGNYDTVAGFVIEQLGRMPRIGDTVTYNGFVITVERIVRHRITRLRFDPSAQRL